MASLRRIKRALEIASLVTTFALVIIETLEKARKAVTVTSDE